MKRLPLAAMLIVTGCAMAQPLANKGTLILKAQVLSGSYNTNTTISPYTQASIAQLTLKLYSNGQDTGIQSTIPGAQLSNSITISNLKPNKTYLIKATAYDSGSQCISTNDANCETTVTLTDNDRPTLAAVKVKLLDRAFNGQATSSIALTPGGYSPIGQENLVIPKQVTTFAGNGTTPFADGVGTSATFNNPRGMAIDASGNLYVADEIHHKIRKITPSGVVTTLAGNGSSATFADGPATVATFRYPSGVCVDSSGNVYVSDTSNFRIRKITPAGVVSTLAGNGTAGAANGTGTAATFNEPYAIAIDPAGNLYVADSENHRIRKIATNGAVSTLAGNGTAGASNGVGTNATFYQPRGIAVGPSGTLYVADRSNNLIRKITSDGTVTTFAGNGSNNYYDGTGTAAAFKTPIGITVDSQGNVYVGGNADHSVRKITPEGVVSTIAGTGTAAFADGTVGIAAFNQPIGVVINEWGDLFVADYSNNRIRHIQ